MRRIHITNEYRDENGELYRSVTQDDPQVLLEGISMAGLLGVLRMLGDVSQFAAEIFHDLHKDVLATASRSHDITTRVHLLEAVVPSFENSFADKTNHSQLLSRSGADLHAKIHLTRSLWSSGVVPRFVTDAWDNCRGPPHLFVLDKFDVAGTGACLKRYSDPSFFKAHAGGKEQKADLLQENKLLNLKRNETIHSIPLSDNSFQWDSCGNDNNLLLNDPSCVEKFKRIRSNEANFNAISRRRFLQKFRSAVSKENGDRHAHSDAAMIIDHRMVPPFSHNEDVSGFMINEPDQCVEFSQEDTNSCETEYYTDALNSVNVQTDTDTDNDGICSSESFSEFSEDLFPSINEHNNVPLNISCMLDEDEALQTQINTDGSPISVGNHEEEEIFEATSKYCSPEMCTKAEIGSSQILLYSAIKSISEMVDANLSAVSPFLDSHFSFVGINEDKEEFHYSKSSNDCNEVSGVHSNQDGELGWDFSGSLSVNSEPEEQHVQEDEDTFGIDTSVPSFPPLPPIHWMNKSLSFPSPQTKNGPLSTADYDSKQGVLLSDQHFEKTKAQQTGVRSNSLTFKEKRG